MVTPVYPASNNQQAIDLNISNANQFFTILQGGIEDFIPTYEGNGEIPSVAKALNEAAAYKVPLAWQTTGEETDLLQPRIFNEDIYVPLTVPAPFSTAPSNEFWRLYSEKTAQVLIDTLTFTGDGVTTDFSIPSMVVDDPSAYLVSVDGVYQRPTIDYTVNVSTDTLTFTEAPPTTVADNISVTILGALRGALAEDIYETTADGLANTSDGQFFNVVNSTDPEAFIDLYKNNAGAALLIDTYPNSVAYNNLANAVAYEADLASNAVGEGSDLIAHTGTPDTVTEALDKRTIFVGSVAELEALSLAEGVNVYLTQEGRAGEFVVKTGTPPSDPQKGIYIILANGNYAERVYSGSVNPQWFGAAGDGTVDDKVAVEAASALNPSIVFPEGVVCGVSSVDLPSGVKLYGPGGLKWLSPSDQLGNFINIQDAVDVLFDGVYFDANNVVGGVDLARFLIYLTGEGCDNFTIQNCKFDNCFKCIFSRHDDSTKLNKNFKLHNNVFDAGTTDRHATHFAASLFNMHGFVCTNNLFLNLAMVSTTTTSSFVAPTSFEKHGDFLISGNVCKDFKPNLLSDATKQSMILIRSTTTNDSFPYKNIEISNNLIEGGKFAISFAEEEDQNFSNVVISGNVCRNNSDGSISVGRNNTAIDFGAVIVSSNTCYWDIDYMNVESPGTAEAGARRHISLEGPGILCEGNSVYNAPESGIAINGDGACVFGNKSVNSGWNESGVTIFGAGILVVDGSGLKISGNYVDGGGFSVSGDTSFKMAGIGLYDKPTITNCMISDNIIKDTDDKLTSAISLCRFAAGTPPNDIFVTGNHLIGFGNKGAIVPRNASSSANLHYVNNNRGWGDVSTTWNPGAVADGATVAVTIPCKDCVIGDIVSVEFAGIRNESVGNPPLWSIAGEVTGSSNYYGSTVGEITVYMTNFTGASQTFTTDHLIRAWIERRNET